MRSIKILRDFYMLVQMRNIYRNGPRLVSTQAVQKVKPFKSIPGLSSIPFLGPLHHFLPYIGEIGPSGQIFNKLDYLRGKYGPIMKMGRNFESASFVILFEPEHFEQVFRAEETNPHRPGFQVLGYYREKMIHPDIEEIYGLMTAQGRKWREFRTKVNPAMLNPKLIKLYATGLEEIADDMVTRIIKLKDQKDLQKEFEEEMRKWSLESVALICFGARLGCLQDNLTDDHPARQLSQTAKDIMDLTFKLEFMPSPWRFISTPTFKKIVKAIDTQWELSTIYVNEARKKINSRGYEVLEEDKSVIEKLLAIDEKVAIMMANEMLLAGIDTVAFTTMNVIYHLAANQNAQDKLRQEIRLGSSNQYLRACLKESTRIWHVVPVNVRRTTKEHVVAGYQIPPGVDVLAPNQYLSNHEKHYPRPQEFLPERWLADKDDPLYYGNAHPLVVLPFGFGIRSCIGRRIAELEMETFLKKLINTLKVSWEGPPLKVKSTFVNEMEKPFRIKFELAN